MRPSETMARWFEEVWNQGREATIEELFPAPCCVHGLGPEPLVGAAAFKAFWSAMRGGFDEVRVEVEDVQEAGDMAILRCTAHLRRGDERFAVRGVSQARIEHGLIREAWDTWDFVPVFQGLGLLPADAMARMLAR